MRDRSKFIFRLAKREERAPVPFGTCSVWHMFLCDYPRRGRTPLVCIELPLKK